MEDKKISLLTSLEFIEDDETFAEAAVGRNPFFQWVKIIVTDDKPNFNKQRVPVEEFDNLINTGLHTPIKMAVGEISKGHAEAYGKPIGTITHLIKDVGNRLVGLAALWKTERGEDIKLLKKMYDDGVPPQVSWEIRFAESEQEDGIEVLRGTNLTGLTVVGAPAYSGRTPFIAMSSKNIEEENSVEELDSLKTENEQLKQKVSELEATLSANSAELDQLREYKATAEKVKQDEQQLAEIKQKFTAAGIEKDANYFTEKKEFLLALSADALDYMLQELVAFRQASASEKPKSEVPNITGSPAVDSKNPKSLGAALRDSKIKK